MLRDAIKETPSAFMVDKPKLIEKSEACSKSVRGEMCLLFLSENLIERGCEATIILKCVLKKKVMWILVGCRSVPPHGNKVSRSLKCAEFFGQMGHCQDTKKGIAACIN